MVNEAPEGSEAPREPLKANIVPATTMWFFLSYEYTLSASEELSLRIGRFQNTLESSTGFLGEGAPLGGNSASETPFSCATIAPCLLQPDDTVHK
jgi:hypothetical protein